jgi:hypothetical protein
MLERSSGTDSPITLVPPYQPFPELTGIITDVELVPVHAHAGFVFRRVLNGLADPKRGARSGGDGGGFGRVAEVGGSEAEA